MIELAITEDELARGQIAPPHLAAAVAALRSDGCVVLNDIVDRAHLELLRERMLSDLDQILARPDAPFNFNTGNLQQDPPPFPPYLFRDVLLNDIVVAVTRAILGPGLRNTYYSGNTALPGGKRQPVHPDSGQLWPRLEHPTPPYALIINVPVVDMDARNGSTELWPGTHLDTTFSVHDGALRIPEDVLERRRAVAPPFQPSVRCGSVVIRDIRLWHAGMPNQTAQPRPMIAMIHVCSWWTSIGPVTFPTGTEEFFVHPELHTNARFVDGAVDHVMHNQSYDLQR